MYWNSRRFNMKLEDAFKPSSPKMVVTFIKSFLDGQKGYETLTITSRKDLDRTIKDAFQGEIRLGDLEVNVQGKNAFSLTKEERENLLRNSKKL